MNGCGCHKPNNEMIYRAKMLGVDPNDMILVKEYDTTVPSTANTGHTFGSDLCPDTAGLARLLGSRVGALLAYLKTL
jgi:hypothetical protein